MRRVSTYSIPVLFFAILLGSALSGFAVDGVVLINQATATNGLPGCAHTGFPIIICKSGSYRLSGDLTIASVNTDAIDISANDVTLDLNGFSILGPVTCQPGTYPLVCSNRGTGVGVNGDLIGSNGLFPANVTLLNGNIRGMGWVGLILEGTGCVVNGVHVEWSGGGLDITTAAIYLLNGVVTHSTANANAGPGIAGVSTTVSFSSASYNGGYGFQGLVGTIFSGGSNSGGFNISNSTASNNGQTGIFDAFLAVHNVSTYNIGFGIGNDGNGYGYLGNIMYGNKGGDVTSLGTSLGQNLCSSRQC